MIMQENNAESKTILGQANFGDTDARPPKGDLQNRLPESKPVKAKTIDIEMLFQQRLLEQLL